MPELRELQELQIHSALGVLAEADSEGAGDEACSSLTPVVEHAESKRPEINSAAMAA